MKLRYCNELILSIAVSAQIFNVVLMSRLERAGLSGCEDGRFVPQYFRRLVITGRRVHLREIPRRFLA